MIVADPNYAPMYATRSRRVKTDRRDARTLAEALRLGAYRPAHRVSALAVPAQLEAELAPLFAVLAPLNAEILAADRRIAALEKTDSIVALLATAPSVGAQDCHASRQSDRGGRAGASPRGDSLRDVADNAPYAATKLRMPSPPVARAG